MAFGTYKPCHGCGETGWKPVNSLCKECTGALRAGRAMKTSEEDKMKKSSVYRLTEDWPTIYSPDVASRRLGRAFAQVARTAMRRMRSTRDPYNEGVNELPPKGPQVHYFSTYDEKAALWVGTKRFASALTHLDITVRESVLAANEAGKQEGSNLLMQIAKGEVSIREL